MSDGTNDVEMKFGADISEAEAGVDRLSAKIDALMSKAANIEIGFTSRAIEGSTYAGYREYEHAYAGGYTHQNYQGFQEERVDRRLNNRAAILAAQGVDIDPDDVLGMADAQADLRVSGIHAANERKMVRDRKERMSREDRAEKLYIQGDISSSQLRGGISDSEDELFEAERTAKRNRLMDAQERKQKRIDALLDKEQSPMNRGSRTAQEEIDLLHERALEENDARDRKMQTDALKQMAPQLRADNALRAKVERDMDKEEAIAQAEQDKIDAAIMGSRRNLAKAGLYAAVSTAQDYLNADLQYTMSGTADPLAYGKALGQFPGAMLGGAVGSLFGPFGTMIGANLGGQFGGGIINSMQGGSYARNRMALDAETYAYGTGQQPLDFVPDYAQRNIGNLNLSRADTGFIGRDRDAGGWLEGAKSAILRGSGLYTGTDQYSDQDAMTVENAIEHMRLREGRIVSGEQAQAQARAYLDENGQRGLRRIPELEKYNDAMTKYSGNIVDTLEAVGVDATMTGLRQSGANFNAGYLAQIAHFDEVSREQQARAGLNIQAADTDFALRGLSGTPLTRSDFDVKRKSQEVLIKALDEDIRNLENIAGGDNSAAVAKLQNAKRQAMLAIAESVEQEVGYNFALGSSVNAVGASQTNLRRTQASLYGGAGSFSQLVGAETADVNAQIAVEERAASQERDPIKANQHRARANMLKAERMMLPSQAQLQDIGRAEERFGADRAELGLASTLAGLYGDVNGIGRAATGSIGENNREIQYLQSQLRNAQSEPIRQQLRARIVGLQQSNVGIAAGASSAELGIERENFGLGLASAQYDAAQAVNFGSDADIRDGYHAQIYARQAGIATLTARLNDPNLSRADRVSIQREIMQQRQGIQADTLAGNDVLLGRMDTDAGLRREDTSFGVDVARRMGSASGYRSAVGADLTELGREQSDITNALSDPTLTYSQRAGLRGRQNRLRRDAFEEEQQAIDEGYRLDDLGGYNIEHLQLSGLRRRSKMLPFGASGGMTLDLLQLRQDEGRRTTLQGRAAELARSGNLTPERRYALMREDDALQDEEAGIVGQMSRGAENYLPGMASGQTSGFSHFNSLNLASLRNRQINSMVSGYGFAGGEHQFHNEQMMRNLAGGGAHVPGVMSAVGSAGRAEGNNGAIVAAIERLIGVMERLSGGHGSTAGAGLKPGEARQGLYGLLSGVSDGQTFGNGLRK